MKRCNRTESTCGCDQIQILTQILDQHKNYGAFGETLLHNHVNKKHAFTIRHNVYVSIPFASEDHFTKQLFFSKNIALLYPNLDVLTANTRMR